MMERERSAAQAWLCRAVRDGPLAHCALVSGHVASILKYVPQHCRASLDSRIVGTGPQNVCITSTRCKHGHDKPQ
uniref:Uncharacterized protein n=1 Tax=Peronospora matthiolae TaxID=2874970 RepID=A0AAV1UKD2_9STRA